MKSFGNNLKSFISNNYKTLLIMLFFFIVNCAFIVLFYHSQNKTIESKYLILITVLSSILTISLCAFIFYTKHKKWPIEKVFLVIGSILGIFYLFAIPIGQTPDEPAHYWRVYNITHGDIVPQAENRCECMPSNLAHLGSNTFNKDGYSNLANQFFESDSTEITHRKTITNNPISYLPQIIGASIGSILHLPTIPLLYLTRLFGLIACIIIIYFCLKYIPILKKPLFFIACLPLSMQSFIAISYDGMIFCSAVSILTFVLYSIYTPKFKLRPFHYPLLALLNIILLASKPTYFPISASLFFIPKHCFKNNKTKILSIIAIGIITGLLYLLWMLLIATPIEPGEGADTTGQISFILSNPLKYLVILIDNMINMPFNYLISFDTMEWLSVQSSQFYFIVIPIVFVLLCTEERLNTKNKTSNLFKWYSIICVILSAALVYTALYVQWTPVGESTIQGVQSRYFLPFLLFVPLACLSVNNKSTNRKPLSVINSTTFYALIVFININTLCAVIFSHI